MVGAELTLALAFATGLSGAGHCWTMCGGLVGGLFLGCGRCAGVQGHAAYHLGRVLGYTVLGALAAGLGQALVLTGGVGQAQGVLYMLAGLAVAGAGLWVAFRPSPDRLGIGSEEKPVGRPGSPSPGRRRFPLIPASLEASETAGPPTRFPAFLAAGLTNALMPCALVYSLAVKAMTAPSIAQGAAWLFVFGLGTVPAMAAAGALAHALGSQSLAWLRRASAVLVIALGAQAVQAGAEFFRVMGHL